MLTGSDVLNATEFILKNRTNKVFNNWTRDQIINKLNHCVNQNTCMFTVCSVGDITGIGVGALNKTGIHIIGLLCLNKESFKLLFKAFLQLCPEHFTITGYRHGNLNEPKNWTLKKLKELYNYV